MFSLTSIRIFIAIVFTACSMLLRAQDYRSKASGNWNALTTW